MKTKLYKAKSLKNGSIVKGYIYQEPEHTRNCCGEIEDIPIRTYIIVPIPGDWGLPYSMLTVPVDPSTIEECGEIEIGGVDKIS